MAKSKPFLFDKYVGEKTKRYLRERSVNFNLENHPFYRKAYADKIVPLGISTSVTQSLKAFHLLNKP